MSVRICQSALEAVSIIESNEIIWTHSMAATPRVLFEALAVHAKTKTNSTLLQLQTERSEALSDKSLSGHLRHRCYFSSTPTRSLLASGDADYVPIFLSEFLNCFAVASKKLILQLTCHLLINMVCVLWGLLSKQLMPLVRLQKK